MKAVLIDDEEDALLVAEELLNTYCPTMSIIGKAQNIQDGEVLIRDQEPEVLFLDISMPNGSGFDLLEKFPDRNFHVVFVTAYQQHSIEALRCSAVDYLLKPINPDELITAVTRLANTPIPQKAQQLYHTLQQNLASDSPNRLVLSTSEGIHFIQLEELVRVEADRNYSHLYLQDGEVITAAKTLGYFERVLPKDKFFRASQSQLVQLSFVKKLAQGQTLILTDRTEVKLGKGMKTLLLDRLS